ncbi:MAG: rhodanese-like domain-containing protein [Proteobacteria bacterium]|nr:rhodanese-like domain-containing protein [Pseudomonadota bacterium]
MYLTPQQLVAEAKPHVREINIDIAVAHINAGSLIVDVREPAEFEAAHLPGAVNIPRGVIEFKTVDHPALANKAAEILLVCKTGGRSVLSAFNLQRMGYTGVLSLTGGFDGWVAHHEKVDKDNTDFGG